MEPPELPFEVERTLERLASAGIRAYLVGGALRDAALGREVRDFDVVALAPLRAVGAALPEAAAIPAQIPILALAFREAGLRVELTGLRGGATTLDEDLRLRDFTLNAIALDVGRSEFIDPCGGRADLAARTLRAVSSARTFVDDPVRILRGVRLAVDLDLTLDPATERAMERASFRLLAAAGERKREELFRLLRLPRATEGLEQLRRLGGLAGVLPELLRLVGVAQNRHHRDDVYTHTLRVCARVRPDPLLRLAALLHDVAKPETKSFRSASGDFSFHRHELRAAPHVARVASRLRLSKHERDVLDRLVRHHLIFPERLASDAAIRRMLRRTGRDILHDLLELRRADLASRCDDPDRGDESLAGWHEAERRILEVAQRERELQTHRVAIGGKDIMRELGLGEGPEVGRWLRRARLRVMERPQENERAKLLRWLRETARAERPCTPR